MSYLPGICQPEANERTARPLCSTFCAGSRDQAYRRSQIRRRAVPVQRTRVSRKDVEFIQDAEGQ